MTTNYNIHQDRIIGKIILTGKIKNTSPLLIGNGKGGEMADIEVILLESKPYIPSSSLAGALRSKWDKEKAGVTFTLTEEAFWGTKNTSSKKSYQSHYILSDLISIDSSKIVIRDGVSIDIKTGVSIKGAKYDYQIVEPGATFEFQLEATLRHGLKDDEVENIVRWIAITLNDDNFRIGALTSTGFGKFILEDCKAYKFTFPEKANDWLDYLKGVDPKAPLFELKDLEKSKLLIENFHITADFQIKSALITGSYGIASSEPDKIHLTSNKIPILSGKAIKGAIRHRASKILDTLLPNEEKTIHCLLDQLFGWVNNNNDDDIKLEKVKYYKAKAIKSRIKIEETELGDSVKSMTQDRIKIDRFTGGVMQGAKFESQPVWKNNHSTFKISISILEYEIWEASLMLYILKDLWTGDLTIGGEKNIGRGVLIGKKAILKFDNLEIELESGLNNTILENLKDIEKFNINLQQELKNLKTIYDS